MSKEYYTCIISVRHCSSLIPVPQNGEIVSRTDVGAYIVGSAVEFSCQQGYTLVGSRILKCSEDGEWDSNPPQCLYIIGECVHFLSFLSVSQSCFTFQKHYNRFSPTTSSIFTNAVMIWFVIKHAFLGMNTTFFLLVLSWFVYGLTPIVFA